MKSSTEQSSLRDRCFFRRSVGHIVMHSKPTAHFRSLWRLSHSRRARGPKYPLPSSMGQCLNDYSNEARDREALTFVFYSPFIRIWQLRVAQIGLMFAHLFQAVSEDMRQESSRVCHAFRSLLCITYQNPLNHNGGTPKRMRADTKRLRFLTLQNE